MDTGYVAVSPDAGVRVQVKPRDIHSYGLKLLQSNGFTIGQSIDITYAKGETRIFALDAEQKRFYFDPAPVGIASARLIFGIYSVDKITGVCIYEREKTSDVKTKNSLGISSAGTIRLRSLGVQITMDDPLLPVLYIQCLPYAAVGNSEYTFRLALAQRILTLLGSAVRTAAGKQF